MKKVFINLALLLAPALCAAQAANPGWHLRYNDSERGINIAEAAEILKNYPKSEIIVALLDTGVETEHPDLEGAIWRNVAELAENGVDDDKNGFIDDVSGWNFLGSADGSYNLTSAGTEAFREYKRLRPLYKNVADESSLPKAKREEFAYFKRVEKEAGIATYIMFTDYLAKVADAFRTCDALIAANTDDRDGATRDEVAAVAMEQEDEDILTAFEVALQRYMLEEPDISWKAIYDKNVGAYETAAKRVESLDSTDGDPRGRVGDNLADFTCKGYGNGNVGLPDSGQGTVLAGVIAAQDRNGYGVRGIYPDAKIMTVRILPEGEPYDKDIAAGIRYAADNGAKVINIGFVKTLSPDAAEIRKAMEYAAKKDVLIVRAAGDKAADLDQTETFPSPLGRKGRRLDNVIVVGASDNSGKPAAYSNYGAQTVDLFAPGVDIVSTFPDGKYMRVEGSDVSAAMVSGIAAAIRAHFPDLTAAQVGDALTASARGVTADGADIYDGLCRGAGIADAAAAAAIAVEKYSKK